MNCTLTSAAVWVGGWVGGRREREVGRVVILPPPPFEALSRPGSPFPARLFPNSCHRRDPTVAARGVQDVIVVGRNFRGTTCTRKGTRGPPVLQVCVWSWRALRRPRVGLGRGVVVVPCRAVVRAWPPPPSPQRILDYFEQRRRVVYLVRAPRSVVWLFLFRFLFLTPAVPWGARWLGVGLDAGRSCRSQLRKSPHPLLCRTSTGRRSAATLAPASWWMDHATARSSASPATRSSTVTSTRP